MKRVILSGLAISSGLRRGEIPKVSSATENARLLLRIGSDGVSSGNSGLWGRERGSV